MLIEIINTTQLGFISWADQTWESPPKPLRRILSLMRMHNAKTLILEKREGCLDKEACADCWSANKNHYKSCADYYTTINKYDRKCEDKICYRLSFASKRLTSIDQIWHINNDEYLGYCIIHKDKVLIKNSKIKYYTYITESVISLPFRKGRFSVSNERAYSQTINGKIFNIKGNYFCQQNSITNCCANAAVKMAIRDLHPSITAECVNEYRGVDHIDVKGTEGMTAKDMKNVFIGMINMESFLLESKNLLIADLLRVVYHAVESRVPVILLLEMSKNENCICRIINKIFCKDERKGHAIAVKGHTFNEHNWWPYGLGAYFGTKKKLNYLSSSLWCDNFIIQDDNMGPYYSLPVQFLFGEIFYGKAVEIREKIFYWARKIVGLKQKNTWLNNDFEILIPYKKEMAFFRNQSLLIEPWVFRIIDKISKEIIENNDTACQKPMRSYFTDYYKNKSLILRTYIIDKSTFFDHLKNDTDLMDNIDFENTDNFIPDYFWITELSIPELFWINKKKIGEIIVDPSKFTGKNEIGVIYARILNKFFFFENDIYTTYSFDSDMKKKWLFKLATPKIN